MKRPTESVLFGFTIQGFYIDFEMDMFSYLTY